MRMRSVSDSDFGGIEFKGKCKEVNTYKYIILDNSGSIALFGGEEDYKLPKSNKLEEVIKVDKVEAELNDQLTEMEEVRGEDKIKEHILVYVAKVNIKDDINVKWVTPEEALKIVSIYKRNIDNLDYNRKFEVLEDEIALRNYIIKYIY